MSESKKHSFCCTAPSMDMALHAMAENSHRLCRTVLWTNILDLHSKWPEVLHMKKTTADATIIEFHRLFSCYGSPEQLVSDNGPQFVSEEFRAFLKGNGVKHIRRSPYHPSSNGAVECFVQIFKKAMQG